MKYHFYDVESLKNAFTLSYYIPNDDPAKAVVEVYACLENGLLIESRKPAFIKELIDRIYEDNSNFHGKVEYLDLTTQEANIRLATRIGICDAYSVTNSNDTGIYKPEFRPVCTTDENYAPEKHPFIFGYNSYNYDTTMLAYYFHETWDSSGKFQYVPPLTMRIFNDELFEDTYKKNMPLRLAYQYANQKVNGVPQSANYKDPKWLIRKNMLMTGRHLDVARLNEKMSHVALKRVLGMLGYQILESNKTTGDTTLETKDDLLDILAYNVSDVVNLHLLFLHPYYQAQFAQKRELLNTYPELIYQRGTETITENIKEKDEKGNEVTNTKTFTKLTYKPNISPSTVRRDRMTADSSSAQFAARSLCPYDHLRDIKTVSFKYPSDKQKALLEKKGQTVEQIDVLDYALQWFTNHFSNHKDAMTAFMNIYKYYDSIRGLNFNNSEYYLEDYGIIGDDGEPVYPEGLEPHVLTKIPRTANNICYYNADGTPSSCFVTFSTGGIHGAEYNKRLYDADMRKYTKKLRLFERAKAIYPDPLELRKAKTVTIKNKEYKYTEFLKSSVSIKKMETMTLKDRQELCWKTLEEPQLFKKLDAGDTKLNNKYTYTSSGKMNHEDFESYYPNLLRNLATFWNKGLGYDRYGEIFDQKREFGVKMKDKSLSDSERLSYSLRRDGTKLILNSASGAADTDYGLPIQMNNYIISMRIIGQLFTWLIGQAQTLEGAKVPSTNTDGLYTVMDAEQNNKILARESKNINVDISPEEIFLISKDSNNRLEMDIKTGKIISASGGSLSCYNDTNPTKSLAHPAIIDWALSEYLIIAALPTCYPELSLDKPFDDKIGTSILNAAINGNKFKDKPHILRMFQNVVSSSTSSMSYIFGYTGDAPQDDNSNVLPLQHYNRVFIMKPGTPGTYHLTTASAKAITPIMQQKRVRDKLRPRLHDTTALYVLEHNDITEDKIPKNREASIKVFPNIDPSWDMLIENHNLFDMRPDRQQWILDNLDLEKYLSLLRKAYEDNWRNTVPNRYKD